MSIDKTSAFELGPIRRLYLLGGGTLLLRFAEWVTGKGVATTIVTAPRHAAERLARHEGTFEEAARRLGPLHILNDINAQAVDPAFVDFDDTSVAVSFGAAWIFTPRTIETLFRKRLLNLHGSRLPQNRGGGGFSWQILSGSRLGFCLLHQVDGGVDTGPVLACEEFLYPAACRLPADYQATYERENLGFLRRTFTPLLDGRVSFSTNGQPEYLSSYWPRLHTPTHAWIDWNMRTSALDQFVCAFDEPYSGAQTLWNGRAVSLKQSLTDFSDGLFHPFQWGLVYRSNGRWLSVAANGGTLIVQSVTDGKGESVLRSIRTGDRFFTPQEKLEGRHERAVYDAHGLKPHK